jgi:hypothetical protein
VFLLKFAAKSMSDNRHFVAFNAVLLVIISTNLFIFPPLAATAINTFSLALAQASISGPSNRRNGE